MPWVNKEHASLLERKLGRTPQIIQSSHAQYWQQTKPQTHKHMPGGKMPFISDMAVDFRYFATLQFISMTTTRNTFVRNQTLSKF
jgi:hypothetical protein